MFDRLQLHNLRWIGERYLTAFELVLILIAPLVVRMQMSRYEVLGIAHVEGANTNV